MHPIAVLRSIVLGSAVILVHVVAGPCFAQTLPELLAAGQFDEAVAAARQEDDHYLSELIRRARQQRLADDPVWHTLLHYKKGLFTGYTSQVDGGDFFTSRQGVTDPEQELETTLASFFSDHLLPPNELSGQCRFRARYHWLNEQLDFDGTRLKEQPCEKFEFYMQALKPAGLTVVFPSTHPGSPSSMFGHTLIRIDQAGQTDATSMLDYTINYAAESDGSGGAAYAFKGLTGGFMGKFHIIPYYMKLREYAQMENRDIWEYPLDVSDASIRFLLMHAWELAPTHFDYYFFTENCSYHLMSLLETDPNNMGMTDALIWWVLPTDTLRLMRNKGLLDQAGFKPSHHRTINARRKQLNENENEIALMLARDGWGPVDAMLAALPEARRAAVLDLAYDYVRYRKIAASDRLDATLNDREREILLARSQLPVVSEALKIAAPTIQPEMGHGTTRIGTAAGVDAEGGFIDLHWRAVYHDWLDPSPGYANNFALEFGRVDGRWYPGVDGRFKLDRAHLIHLDNFEPRDTFFSHLSWSVTTGWESLSRRADDDALMYVLHGGAGLSYRLFGERALLFGLGYAEAAYSRKFAHQINLAAGARVGLAADYGRWRFSLTAQHLQDVSGDDWDRSEVELSQSFAVGNDLALHARLLRSRLFDGWRSAASLGVYVYF